MQLRSRPVNTGEGKALPADSCSAFSFDREYAGVYSAVMSCWTGVVYTSDATGAVTETQ